MEWWCQNFNRKFINGRSCACAVKTWLKIALNAVRLPKFEPVNGISWSPRKIMVKDLRQRSGLAESCVVFNTGPYTVLPDNSILITANMQSETGFPSSHQLKSYVASKSRLKLAARAVLSADAGLLVQFIVELWCTVSLQKKTNFVLWEAETWFFFQFEVSDYILKVSEVTDL